MTMAITMKRSRALAVAVLLSLALAPASGSESFLKRGRQAQTLARNYITLCDSDFPKTPITDPKIALGFLNRHAGRLRVLEGKVPPALADLINEFASGPRCSPDTRKADKLLRKKPSHRRKRTLDNLSLLQRIRLSVRNHSSDDVRTPVKKFLSDNNVVDLAERLRKTMWLNHHKLLTVYKKFSGPTALDFVNMMKRKFMYPPLDKDTLKLWKHVQELSQKYKKQLASYQAGWTPGRAERLCKKTMAEFNRRMERAPEVHDEFVREAELLKWGWLDDDDPRWPNRSRRVKGRVTVNELYNVCKRHMY